MADILRHVMSCSQFIIYWSATVAAIRVHNYYTCSYSCRLENQETRNAKRASAKYVLLGQECNFTDSDWFTILENKLETGQSQLERGYSVNTGRNPEEKRIGKHVEEVN
jgi:hypothetical protein